MTGRAEQLAAQVRKALDYLVGDPTQRGNHEDAIAALTELVALAEQAEQVREALDDAHQAAITATARVAELERERNETREKLGWYERTRWVPRLKEERDRADSLAARVAELETALERYGEHDRSCNYVGQPVFGICTCGYLAVAAAPSVTANTEKRATCEICGKSGDVAYRGWHDDGNPMLTCSECPRPAPAAATKEK